jgi:O-antigen/teichoic acid export membrane protein
MRWMAAAIPPFVVSEVLLAATMGKRRMAPQVIVRDTLTPVVLLASAAALHVLGFAGTGLSVAFFASQVAALIGATIAFARVFPSSRFPDAGLPRELVRFAAPMWLGHITNSAAQRVDVVLVGALTDPATVGVYSIVVQFANALRAIRRSFDPIVSAIVTRLSVRPDSRRLADGYSYASALVTTTQVPVFVALACLGPWLLPLYGEGFGTGATALLVSAAFWGVMGPFGLAGVVVLGYGRSWLSFLNVVVTLLLIAVFVLWLTPRWGIEGAAFGTGLAYLVQHALQLGQMRAITGSFNYTRAVIAPFAVAFGALAAGTIAWVVLAGVGNHVERVGALVVFFGSFVPGVWFLRRTGRLGAPSPRGAPA